MTRATLYTAEDGRYARQFAFVDDGRRQLGWRGRSLVGFLDAGALLGVYDEADGTATG
jgi:hypothetical protein